MTQTTHELSDPPKGTARLKKCHACGGQPDLLATHAAD